MSADVIQFVPKANPKRASLLEAAEAKASEFLEHAPMLVVDPQAFNAALPVWPDFSSAGRFHSPDKDSA